MHGAVQAGRRQWRVFSKWERAIGVDRVRADVDHMGYLDLVQRLDDRRNELQIVGQHPAVLDWCDRGHGDDSVGGSQEAPKGGRAINSEKINLRTAEGQRG